MPCGGPTTVNWLTRCQRARLRIDQLSPQESDEVLAQLFEHQLQPRFRYRFEWQPRSVLMWDNMGTIHNAVADYRPDEPRLIKRCQVAATRFFPIGPAPH